MLLRSLAVIVFIAIVGATAIYFAQRPTIARGDVLGADLLKANPTVRSLDCDKDVPIGMTGGTFNCNAEFKNGDRVRYKFAIDRNGSLSQVEQSEVEVAPRVKKTADPWGD